MKKGGTSAALSHLPITNKELIAMLGGCNGM